MATNIMLPEEGIIKNREGIITNNFAVKFLETAGLEAELCTTAGACNSEEGIHIIYTKSPDTQLFFKPADIRDVFLRYHRGEGGEIADSADQFLERSDLLNTLKKISINAGYDFSPGCISVGPRFATTIDIISPGISRKHYQKHAEFIGNVDKMISLYLKK